MIPILGPVANTLEKLRVEVAWNSFGVKIKNSSMCVRGPPSDIADIFPQDPLLRRIQGFPVLQQLVISNPYLQDAKSDKNYMYLADLIRDCPSLSSLTITLIPADFDSRIIDALADELRKHGFPSLHTLKLCSDVDRLFAGKVRERPGPRLGHNDVDRCWESMKSIGSSGNPALVDRLAAASVRLVLRPHYLRGEEFDGGSWDNDVMDPVKLRGL